MKFENTPQGAILQQAINIADFTTVRHQVARLIADSTGFTAAQRANLQSLLLRLNSMNHASPNASLILEYISTGPADSGIEEGRSCLTAEEKDIIFRTLMTVARKIVLDESRRLQALAETDFALPDGQFKTSSSKRSNPNG